ncbi:MAG: rSAM-modified peptide [Candidatus Aminicenantes bacterium]|nr:rSAM-modified peptide [Candidatus Aminicenantes bacterium]NIM82323.1 rSAM-modified peptide [Candidatus Aminicenantes bacterium]NIN21706.1 rSAM-modified peptide [Candidatus Aminicenantes bacterium]NIN45515.1 rSAM-modified peptide [Candidatus Aminicenantes bacterium]NIN88346.1 rSAM-modified peptide [Candidatus Aminicenantes bacterium]
MKTKKITKLSLNKTTIANLGRKQMSVAKGGDGVWTEPAGCSDPGSTCRYCPTINDPLCQPTADCPPTVTENTLCLCESIDLPCKTDYC